MVAEGASVEVVGHPRLRAAGAAFGVGFLTVAMPVAAVASPTSSPQSAFWFLAEPVTGLIPVPGVPAGGLFVASAPTGAEAESAVRFSVVVPDTVVRLTLHVAAKPNLQAPVILGYPANGHWQTGGPQPWSARPSYRTIAKPVNGVFNAAGKTMTLSFPSSEAAAGIVLVPGSSGGGTSPTFTVSFDPPTAADITVTRPFASPSASASPHPPTHKPTHGTHSATPSDTSSSHTPKHRTTHSPGGPAAGHPSPSLAPPATTPSSPTNSATVRSHSSRSTRDILVLACLLAGVLVFLLWGRRPGATRKDKPGNG